LIDQIVDIYAVIAMHVDMRTLLWLELISLAWCLPKCPSCLRRHLKWIFRTVHLLSFPIRQTLVAALTDSDNTVCSLFVRDARSELLCLCNAYSTNERNIIERIIQSAWFCFLDW